MGQRWPLKRRTSLLLGLAAAIPICQDPGPSLGGQGVRGGGGAAEQPTAWPLQKGEHSLGPCLVRAVGSGVGEDLLICLLEVRTPGL